jgi:hypothetical protein
MTEKNPMTRSSKCHFNTKLKLIVLSGLIAVALAVAKHLEISSLLSLSANLTNLRCFSQRQIKVLTHSDKRGLGNCCKLY